MRCAGCGGMRHYFHAHCLTQWVLACMHTCSQSHQVLDNQKIQRIFRRAQEGCHCVFEKNRSQKVAMRRAESTQGLGHVCLSQCTETSDHRPLSGPCFLEGLFHERAGGPENSPSAVVGRFPS